ncbi:MAG TPA: response regulator [bacterium]|nr:response regulator [bacterium]
MHEQAKESEKRRVLIVDADEQVTAVLALKLRQQGYETLSLSSTVNALAMIRDFLPHLIISEMVLPELSGVDFLKRIKMNPETAHIPFIFLSSSRNVEDKIIAHEMGAESFFSKPIFIKVLINRINDFFQERDFREILSSVHEQETFSGSLQNISVIDLLNIVHENRRQGLITLVSAGGEKGAIHFADGALVRIEREGADDKNGEEIFYSLLPWSEGDFTVTYTAHAVEPNITEPFERLMVSAMSWLSEYQAEIGEMPPLDVLLHLRFSAVVEHLAKLPDTIGALLSLVPRPGIRVGELIEKGGDDRKRTVEQIRKLLSLGVLGTEPDDTPVPRWDIPVWARPVTATGRPVDTVPIPPSTTDKKLAPSPALPGETADLPPVRPTAPVPRPAPTPAPAPPAPAPVEPPAEKTAPPEDKDDGSFIESLYQDEPAPTRSSGGRTLLIAALLIAVAGGGTALWYVFSQSAEEVPQIEEPATAPVPDTVVVAPVEPPPPPDPFAGKSTDELLKIGIESHKTEQYGAAIAAYRAALKALPADTEPARATAIWKNLAISAYEGDDQPTALDAVEQALAVDIDADKIALKAAILEEMGQFDDAMNAYRAFLKDKRFKANKKEWIKEITDLKKKKKQAEKEKQ